VHIDAFDDHPTPQKRSGDLLREGPWWRIYCLDRWLPIAEVSGDMRAEGAGRSRGPD
jgi:hypothetical protein